MYTREQEASLVSDLIYVLGINVNPTDNILIDQDTQQPILFEGKNIKVTRSVNKPAFITVNDIKLEPANPKCTKLMSRMFSFFIDKEENDGEIKPVLTFYFDDDLERGVSKLVVKFIDGEKYETQERRSKALLYTEAIMDLDGSFPTTGLDLFDVDEDIAIERRK